MSAIQQQIEIEGLVPIGSIEPSQHFLDVGNGVAEWHVDETLALLMRERGEQAEQLISQVGERLPDAMPGLRDLHQFDMHLVAVGAARGQNIGQGFIPKLNSFVHGRMMREAESMMLGAGLLDSTNQARTLHAYDSNPYAVVEHSAQELRNKRAGRFDRDLERTTEIGNTVGLAVPISGSDTIDATVWPLPSFPLSPDFTRHLLARYPHAARELGTRIGSYSASDLMQTPLIQGKDGFVHTSKMHGPNSLLALRLYDAMNLAAVRYSIAVDPQLALLRIREQNTKIYQRIAGLPAEVKAQLVL